MLKADLSGLNWYSPNDYLPPTDTLVISVEITHDPTYTAFHPVTAWLSEDGEWRTREPGVVGGRIIHVMLWAFIPSGNGNEADQIRDVNPARMLFALLEQLENAKR